MLSTSCFLSCRLHALPKTSLGRNSPHDTKPALQWSWLPLAQVCALIACAVLHSTLGLHNSQMHACLTHVHVPDRLQVAGAMGYTSAQCLQSNGHGIPSPTGQWEPLSRNGSNGHGSGSVQGWRCWQRAARLLWSATHPQGRQPDWQEPLCGQGTLQVRRRRAHGLALEASHPRIECKKLMVLLAALMKIINIQAVLNMSSGLCLSNG